MDIIHSTNLVPFLIAALALNLTPGADMAYVATVGAQRGWQHGALAAIGIGAGCIGHVLPEDGVEEGGRVRPSCEPQGYLSDAPSAAANGQGRYGRAQKRQV